MCILFGKQAKTLREELTYKVNECTKLRAAVDDLDKKCTQHIAKIGKLERAVAEMETELKEVIKERNELSLQIASKDNTIKNLHYELAKYEPKRDNKGRFSKKK